MIEMVRTFIDKAGTPLAERTFYLKRFPDWDACFDWLKVEFAEVAPWPLGLRLEAERTGRFRALRQIGALKAFEYGAREII